MNNYKITFLVKYPKNAKDMEMSTEAQSIEEITIDKAKELLKFRLQHTKFDKLDILRVDKI